MEVAAGHEIASLISDMSGEPSIEAIDQETTLPATTNDLDNASGQWELPQPRDVRVVLLPWYLPERMRYSITNMPRPGGLPLEIWYQVIDHLTGLNSLQSLSLSCKILSCIAIQLTLSIEDKITHIERRSDLTKFQRGVSRQSPRYLLMRRIWVNASLMTPFLYRFVGRLPRVQEVIVAGIPSEESNYHIPALRPHVLAAAAQFHNVTKLSLVGCLFWNFTDFARFVFIFPNLRTLELLRISWRREVEDCWGNESAPRSLALQQVEIADADVSRYRRLLTAPEFLHSVITLCLIEPPSGFTIFLCEFPDTVLSPHPICRIIVMGPVYSTAWVHNCCNLLDNFIYASASACAEDLSVVLTGWKEIAHHFTSADLPFRSLRARGILKMEN